MKHIRFEITGVAPLMMNHNNGNLRPAWFEELCAKEGKSADDYERIYKHEWASKLYLTDRGPAIPACYFESMLREVMVRRRADSRFNCSVSEDVDLQYEGPRDPDGMWADGRFTCRSSIRLGKEHLNVVRLYPQWDVWNCEFTIALDPSVDCASAVEVVQLGGRIRGVGCWRPRYGRFAINSVMGL